MRDPRCVPKFGMHMQDKVSTALLPVRSTQSRDEEKVQACQAGS